MLRRNLKLYVRIAIGRDVLLSEKLQKRLLLLLETD